MCGQRAVFVFGNVSIVFKPKLACASTVGLALFCYYDPTTVALINAGVFSISNVEALLRPLLLGKSKFFHNEYRRLTLLNFKQLTLGKRRQNLGCVASGASTSGAPASILTGADEERSRVGVVGGNCAGSLCHS